MKYNIDVVINVSDENRIKSIPELYERVSGNDEVQVITRFVMAFTRIVREIHEREMAETKGVNDDIPF